MILPEHDFGTQFQHMTGTEGILYDGFLCLLKIIFNNTFQEVGNTLDNIALINSLHQQFKIPNEVEYHKEDAVGVLYSHPVYLVRMFSPGTKISTPSPRFNYTISGLAKLLLFEHYVKAQSNGSTYESFVNAESAKYPYKLRANPGSRVIIFL